MEITEKYDSKPLYFFVCPFASNYVLYRFMPNFMISHIFLVSGTKSNFMFRIEKSARNPLDIK